MEECLYFNTCKQYIHNLKYYVKNNKINNLILMKNRYEIYKTILFYKNNVSPVPNKYLLYLNEKIFTYIYKYGYKYKCITTSSKLIEYIINPKIFYITHFFNDCTQNEKLIKFDEYLNLGYYINFAKYLKKEKIKNIFDCQ